MEESLTLDELAILYESLQKQEYEQSKFAAALKGINLDEYTDGAEQESVFDRVKKRVDEKLAGETPEARAFREVGFVLEDEDDEEEETELEDDDLESAFEEEDEDE